MVNTDIPGAFLYANDDDYMIMKMVGTLAELMVKTIPRLYRQYVVIEKGRSILYLQLQKGSIWNDEECIAFYNKLVAELQDLGFEKNPYGPCVANKMVNGLQMMIRWYVDDLMISHLKQEEIMQVVQQIKDIYCDNLKENVGAVHDYLGMTFDYSFYKEVQINMWDYI
jgi:hypothetical protein